MSKTIAAINAVPAWRRRMSRTNSTEGRLLSHRLIAFASLMLPVVAAQMPIAVYIPALYAQHFGLPLAVLGAIFLAERISQ